MLAQLSLRDCPHVESVSVCGRCSARAISVCGALNEAGLDRLAAIAEALTLPADATLAYEGDPAEHLFNITSGVVRVSKLLPDGRRQIVGFLFAGDFLGMAAGAVYPFSAEAVEPVTVCRFRRGAYRTLLAELPSLEAALLDRASHDLQAAQEHMLLLGRKSAAERLASFLLDVAARGPGGVRKGGEFPLPMSRSEIGDYLGLTIETVSRTLTKLKSAGVITLPTARSARVEDPERLRRLAGGRES